MGAGSGHRRTGPVVGAPEWVARWFLVAAAIGFPFWIAFAWFYELTPEGIRRESDVDADKSILKATGRRLDFLIIGVLAIAVVLLLTDRLLRHDTSVAPPAPVIAEKSVAVLPLVNESGDANALYFSDGLSEAFIDALSLFPDSRSSRGHRPSSSAAARTRSPSSAGSSASRICSKAACSARAMQCASAPNSSM